MTPGASMVRRLLKRLHVGPALLRVRRAAKFGLRAEAGTALAKRRYLKEIRKASPLASGEGLIDCFMLLNEARFWEGLWALYSFRLHFGPSRIVVLNDGSLRPESCIILKTLFPGLEVPPVIEHDEKICARLEAMELTRCLAWRRRFVFFRKLIDPCLLVKGQGMILLDSDCLHFHNPDQVISWAASPDRVLFIADLARYSFCAPHDTLSRICDAALPEFFCAGYLCIPRNGINLERIEEYLSDTCFDEQLECGKFSHVAEQTLQAMEAAVVGAEMLPKSYATCPAVPATNAVAGHFCGGSVKRTWFYTKGLPEVASQIGLK